MVLNNDGGVEGGWKLSPVVDVDFFFLPFGAK